METIPEIELKFEVDDSFVLPAFVTEQPLTEIPSLSPIKLDALYFDTRDLALFRAGVTLRRRSGGGDQGWHLKLQTESRATRLELHFPLTEATRVPAEVSEAVFALRAGEPLIAVAEIKTTRAETVLVEPNGNEIAKIADDRVQATSFLDHELTHWREIEIEFTTGNLEAEDQFTKYLKSSGARRASYGSKLGRALDQRDCSRASSKHRDLLAQRVNAQMLDLLRRDIEVRCQVDDAVHRMRVATRRLRSCVRTFQSVLDYRGVDHLEAELSWLGDLLGAERDAEVIGEEIKRAIVENSIDRSAQALRLHLENVVSSLRSDAHDALEDGLHSPRYVALLQELHDFSVSFSSRTWHRVAPRKLRNLVLREVHRAVRQHREAFRQCGAEKESALHELRKIAKRVRYGAETLALDDPKPAQQLRRSYEDLQAVLGRRHDAVMAKAFLEGEDFRAAEYVFAIEVLRTYENELAQGTDEELAVVWAQAQNKNRWKWLK